MNSCSCFPCVRSLCLRGRSRLGRAGDAIRYRRRVGSNATAENGRSASLCDRRHSPCRAPGIRRHRRNRPRDRQTNFCAGAERGRPAILARPRSPRLASRRSMRGFLSMPARRRSRSTSAGRWRRADIGSTSLIRARSTPRPTGCSRSTTRMSRARTRARCSPSSRLPTRAVSSPAGMSRITRRRST